MMKMSGETNRFVWVARIDQTKYWIHTSLGFMTNF